MANKYSLSDISIIPSMKKLMAAYDDMLENPNVDFKVKDYPEMLEGYEPEPEDPWDKDDTDTDSDLPIP